MPKFGRGVLLAAVAKDIIGFLDRESRPNYGARNKGLQMLLSNSQAGPGRTVKQEQEDISCNHVQAFVLRSVYVNFILLELSSRTASCARASLGSGSGSCDIACRLAWQIPVVWKEFQGIIRLKLIVKQFKKLIFCCFEEGSII